MQIILDMDEVLVDFVGGVAKLYDTTREAVREKQTPGVWDIAHTFDVSAPTLYRNVYKVGLGFWLKLEPLPWIDELIELVEQFDPDWQIATSPNRAADSYFGKACWLKNYFGTDFDRFVITPHKHLFAKEGTVLIDDKEENVQKFKAAGGRGIVFPTKGNCCHHIEEPLEFVRGSLLAIKQFEEYNNAR